MPLSVREWQWKSNPSISSYLAWRQFRNPSTCFQITHGQTDRQTHTPRHSECHCRVSRTMISWQKGPDRRITHTDALWVTFHKSRFTAASIAADSVDTWVVAIAADIILATFIDVFMSTHTHVFLGFLVPTSGFICHFVLLVVISS